MKVVWRRGYRTAGGQQREDSEADTDPQRQIDFPPWSKLITGGGQHTANDSFIDTGVSFATGRRPA